MIVTPEGWRYVGRERKKVRRNTAPAAGRNSVQTHDVTYTDAGQILYACTRDAALGPGLHAAPMHYARTEERSAQISCSTVTDNEFSLCVNIE